jgi:ubiquinone/menaquinone biosynthesis C-methylase UbiE
MILQRREEVQEQYRDAGNLTARADLHQRFGSHPTPWQEWAFDQLPPLDGATVLDVGCGPCWLWRENVGRIPPDARVVAMDLSLGMAIAAREGLGSDERFEFITGDVQALPLEDSSFDIVVANHMLYHLPDLDAGLAEIVRVLRPGGMLAAATNGAGHMAELRTALGDVGPRYAEAFGLESGPAKIERFFDEVAVKRRSDVLRVTDPDAAVAYARSMAGVDADVESFERHVSSVIADRGAFEIHTDGGVITGMRT